MKFHALEPYPEINPRYFKYLRDNWHKIFLHWHDVDKSRIDWIIVRSKVIVDKELIDSYPNLKYVCRVWVWTEKIDTDYLTRKNIKLLTTPNANSSSVAQIALWGILSLLRKTNNNFSNIDDRFNYMWWELSNKTIWIIWFWNIWRKLFKLIDAFWENDFLIYDPFLDPKDFSEKNIRFVSDKNELFRLSDILSFHIPLLPSTKDFLWKEWFWLLKKDVKIINTSRWWVINEFELIDFLRNNLEAWAYLDVWEEEPSNPKKELQGLKNCIITPHIWAMTLESNEKMHYFEI